MSSGFQTSHAYKAFKQIDPSSHVGTTNGPQLPSQDATAVMIEVLREGRECPPIFQVRMDIKPLCDEHNSGTDIRELDTDCAHTFYVYLCCEPDCDRVFCRLRGYYDSADETGAHVHRCPHDEQAMFRKEIDIAGRSSWECPRVDCGRQIRL